MSDDLKERLHSPEGHDEPCYYCGEPVRHLAADPSLWPLPFCHQSEPGVVKWHHTGCVTARLDRAKRYREALEKIAQIQRDKCQQADAGMLFMLLDNKVCIATAALQEPAMPSEEAPPPVAADQSPDALAHAYAIEWQKADLSDYVELHGLLERLIRDVRAAERARIAKIVCSECRDGVPFKNHGTHLLTTASGAEFEVSCSAAAFTGPADER